MEYVYTFAYEPLVIDKYIKWDQSESSDFDISSLPADLGKELSEIAASYQIAWYIYDSSNLKVKFYTSDYKTGKWVITSPGQHTVSNYSGGWTDSGDGIENVSLSSGDLSGIWNTVNKIRVIVPDKSTESFENYPYYTVVCEVKVPSTSTAATVKYVFHFNATGKDPNAFEGDLKASGKEGSKSDVVATSATSATLDMSEALSKASGAKYVRFYLEKNGTIVAPTDKLTVTGGTNCPETNQGFYIYKETGLTEDDLAGITLQLLPEGQFEDYKVISVFSTDAPTFDGTTIQKEPDWNLRYTYAFEYPFKGDVTNATKIEKSFVQVASDWSKYNSEVYVKFDFATGKIYLYQPNDTGTPLASVDFLDEQDSEFWSAYSNYTLASGDNFYIRWFLKDKATGIETYIPNSIRNWNGVSIYEHCAKEQYARFWSTKMSSEKSLGTIMRIKVDGTPDSPGTTFNLTDYDLVCTISTAGNDELNASNQVTMEATPMQMQYTFHFNNKGFEADNINDPSLKTLERKALYDPSTGTAYVELFSKELNAIVQEIGTTKDAFDKKGYMRWYIADADGIIISDISDWQFTDINDAYPSFTFDNQYGIYTANFETQDYRLPSYDPTIIFPASERANYQNYRAVCVVTDDLTGMYSEYGYAPYDYEPVNMKVKYVFRFVSAEEYYSDFPADNINDQELKVVYKNALYDKTTGQITPVLFGSSSDEVVSDLQISKATLGSNGYARWYVTDKNGVLVSDMADWSLAATNTYSKNDIYGYYSLLSGINEYDIGSSNYDPIITMPATHDRDTDYKNYQVVCVITTDQTGIDLPATEPTNMQVKYVFNLILTEDEYANLPFVHYKGVTGRNWITPEGSDGSMAQKIWNPATGEMEDYNGDIRQGVHTYEYDIYLTDNELSKLELPIEDYATKGNSVEPRAYFRWYDWKTDKAVVNDGFTFWAENSEILKPIDGRGLFALNLGVQAWHGNVGVNFQAGDEFSTSIDIACDVSRYADGITTFGSTNYLVHEPTLSTRYIFHIRPASEIANKLTTAGENLNSDLTTLKNITDVNELHKKFADLEGTMWNMPEDYGRVVVSLGSGKKGKFALRLNNRAASDYFFYGEGNNLIQAEKIQWMAYYESGDAILQKSLVNGGNRIEEFNYNGVVDANPSDSDRDPIKGFSFVGNDYYPLMNNATQGSEVSVTDGMKFHVVAFVGDSEMDVNKGAGNYAPVAHYEILFLVAPPIKVKDLLTYDESNVDRTDEYMVAHYDLKNILDFDGNPETNSDVIGREAQYYSTENWYDAPSSSVDNMTWEPLEWDEVQYGFSYPQLMAYSKHGMGTAFGIAPLHSDYQILKSMFINGISTSYRGDVPVYPYNEYFWDPTKTPFYDYTYTYTYGRETDETQKKYGSFFYTDASHESRTIATLPFEAALCSGSTIYFTMAVADKTYNWVKPQLLVRILQVDNEGNRTNVVSFHTSNIVSAGASQTGEWYQVYGKCALPNTFDDSGESFIAEVINYANNTNGADFAIDQLTIYTSTAKLEIAQTGSDCDNPWTDKTRIFIDEESLQNLYGKSNTEEKIIYWRVYDEDGNIINGEYDYTEGGETKHGYMYCDEDGIGWDNSWGQTKVRTADANNVTATLAELGDNPGWYKVDDRVYFQVANRYLSGMKEGKTYFVSFFDPQRTFSEGLSTSAAYWGGLNVNATSKCSTFSPFFIPRQQYVDYSNDEEGTGEGGMVTLPCSGELRVEGLTMLLKKPDLSEPTGFKNITGLHYDFFFGTMNQWNSTSDADVFTHSGTNYKYSDLKAAYLNFRVTSGSTATGAYTTTNVAILDAAIAEGLLALDYETTFSHTFSSMDNTSVVCLPVETVVPESSPAIMICSPFEVTFNLVTSAPELALGFSDVEYPRGYDKRVLRVGLEQLNNLKANGYKLHVPVQVFKNKGKQAQTGMLRFTTSMLTISAAGTDPLCPPVGTNFAKILNADTDGNHPIVDADHMYLALDFSGDNCAINNFHEGYEYEVSTSFYDDEDAAHDEVSGEVTGMQEGKCASDLYLIVKVVPEFVTWEAQKMEDLVPGTTDDYYYNANWNNDANWSRSERAELYKDKNDDTGKKQNTKTPGHPYGYDNNAEIDENLSSIPRAYVPMKFTYVTLPEGCRAPSLINMNLVAYYTSPYTGGNLLSGDLKTDPSPADETRTVSSDATTNIKYDMLVRYTEEVCQGHLKSDKATVVTRPGNIYDCEKFYGNICKEIYFKPEAELINQQRLTYEKAWVEKEMLRNQWYLLSTPLKATYAGDMYVPVSMANVSDGNSIVAGRQVTEAFQPINFSLTENEVTGGEATSTPAYSRTKYPIYQRSWDHDGTGEVGSTVYTESSDARQPYYSADLLYQGEVTTKFAQWGHTYNDVQVPYSALQGFSIRPNKKDGTTTGEKALLRLPKADTDYTYYKYNDKTGATELTQETGKAEVDEKPTYGRFLTDDYDNKATMTKVLQQPNANEDNLYYLVGNPYMSSIDMEKFFAVNTALTGSYWKLDGVPETGLTTGIIRPLESFFVKLSSAPAAGADPIAIAFDNSMMIDGNAPTTPAPSREGLTLRTAQSRAVVSLSEEANGGYAEGEDVETLFDSQLSDVPVVYTVAGQQAVSIDVRPELTVVPFGVTCAASSEPVEVTLSGMDAVAAEGRLYVIDAAEGTATEVADGAAVSIQPNDYGRYFLSATSDLGHMAQKELADGIIVSVRGQQVTVTASQPLTSVNTVTLGGAQVNSLQPAANSCQYQLPKGVYIIDARTGGARQRMKVVVE